MKRRAWLTVGAVVLGGAGVVTIAVANPSDPPKKPHQQERAAKLRTLQLDKGGVTERELPATGTDPFSLVGIGWDSATVEVKGTAQVRTRNAETGKWSGWQALELDAHRPDGAEATAHGASEPLWVGPSTGVQVRVDSGKALPKNLKLHMVDPGVSGTEAKNPAATVMDNAAFAVDETPSASPGDPVTPTAPASPTDTAAPTDSATPTSSPTDTAEPTATPTVTPSPTPTKPTAPPSTVKQPPIIGRAQWGADEAMVDDPAEYIDKVQAVFIHHTVGTNNYSCAESAALVRGIMTYHVKTEGWNDLGYNFLVDKCGQIFEGRAGGVDLPVKGAHTYGFNSYSTGIALLGDFEGDTATAKPAGKPTTAALQSAARLAAWKLGQYGGNPKATVTLTAQGNTGKWTEGQQATMNVISGHRDAFATACPGKNLYAKLSSIRDFAVSAGRNSAIPTSDFDRNGITDLAVGLPKIAATGGTVSVLPGGTNGPVATARRTLTQASPGVPGENETSDNFGSSSAYGDVNGDGYADLAIGALGEDDDSGHGDTGSVTVMYGPGLDTGKQYMTSPAYRLISEKLGSAVTVGDFNADGRADVLTVAPGKPGRWWVFEDKSEYATKAGFLGTSAYTAATSLSSAVTGDFNRDGYADVAISFRDPGGIARLLWLKGSSTGLQRVGILDAKGGRSLAAGDLNGDGYADLAVGQPVAAESGHTAKGGAVTAVFGSATGLTSTGRLTFSQDTTGVPDTGETGDDMGASISIGDVNLDGYGDILTGLPGEDITRGGVARTNAGQVILLRGSATGPTATGSVAYHQDTAGVPGDTETNDRLGSSVSLTDLSGYTRADLAIGADGEDANDGAVLQIDNSGTSGVIPSSGVYYGVTVLGAPTGARVGLVLTP
ncbi:MULTISPECIES: FG-GAP-like repeat-containing protein [unclassified Streptomyces]|uniref:FG-GAP-like repeat-containing protein n=1 Tax=unclassified Streptomyces TaxID=2593676 RepID=UPI002DDB1AF2|nr:FG-GAP-like repeat-containing protein [Streptomyces sp. NBC_01750]WSA98872.1 N-acetylmuramoyl-L-alanine amidase [Streptomyces sp. NBC_01794]WSD36557.1 N-acetylmuramoyl-L-alanine amidase [Streptomyces sp. NBC_01750]